MQFFSRVERKNISQQSYFPSIFLHESEFAGPLQKPTTSAADTVIYDDATPDSPTSVDNSVHEYDPVVEMADFNSPMSRLPNK